MSRMGAADSGPGLSAPTVTVRGDAVIRSEPDEAVLSITLSALADAPVGASFALTSASSERSFKRVWTAAWSRSCHGRIVMPLVAATPAIIPSGKIQGVIRERWPKR
jgi:hypothetical protein